MWPLPTSIARPFFATIKIAPYPFLDGTDDKTLTHFFDFCWGALTPADKAKNTQLLMSYGGYGGGGGYGGASRGTFW